MAFVSALLLGACAIVSAEEFYVEQFKRIELTDVYYSEGVNIGDVNADGAVDIVHGPYWFVGPDWHQRHEIYPARAQPRERYADSFFSWVRDFDADGWPDVLSVGFPGTPAFVYENPGPAGWNRPWPKHQVFDWVSNESPQFTNLVGDERPELVCTRDGRFGYAAVNWARPFEPWTFHPISDAIAPKQFGHGLGVGDINGDGRPDVLMKDGWFEQPPSLAGDPLWPLHKVAFAPRGGADMYAYDVDGDGDNDVITSLDAHAYGLAWYEQRRDDGRITFRRHLIMGRRPEDSRYGLVFTELHTVRLADMDGDGLQDIVTGKTYWSHHTKSPLWDAGAVVYWFRLVRDGDGIDWVPYQADDQAGVGRQVIVGDVNGDRLPDIVAGGMKGCHVLLHSRRSVDAAAWRRAQPKPYVPMAAGLSPAEAARRMAVPEGFHVTLAAGEPQVHQPVAMAIDDRGRLWVAEAYNYPLRAPEGQGKDKIIILEDTDGDGTLDRRKVFADGLNLVSGLEVGFGGVWVGAAPYLLFIPDKNGDDRPDGPPQVLLDGFGYQDTHETLNAFIWGPDGWLYGCQGVFTHSRVGPPGTPDDQRVPINAGVWRYHPTRHQFEVFAWGTSNPWGVDFNDYGQAFCTACVIPHLYHVIQGARYQRQSGRHFSPYVYDDIKTIADHLHYAGDIRQHAWWGREPELPQDTSRAGGGHAHCGAMIYLGDNWPERYRNQLFVNNIHGNRVNNDILQRRGSGYVGRHGRDFLLARDKWFRGINLRYGPDGSVWLIDWYDRNACHRTTPEIWDRTNGRIYKISYGQPRAVRVDLAKLSDLELVQLQTHRNDWYVRMARRLLQQRGGNARVHRALEQLLQQGQTVPVKLRALWALHVTGGLTDVRLLELLDSPDEYLRAWAIQLQLEDRQAPPEFLQKMAELSRRDPSPVVRLYLASALQRLPLDERWPIAEGLAGHAEDAADHNLPLMYWYGLEPLVVADARRAMRLADQTKIPLLRQFVLRRLAADNRTLDLVAGLLSRTSDAPTQQMILDQMLAAFSGRVRIPMPPAWKAAYERLSASGVPAVRERAERVALILGDRRIFPQLRRRLLDRALSIEQRRQALEMLVRVQDPDAAPAVQAVLAEPALRSDALRALATMDHPETPRLVLKSYAQLTPEQRRDAIGTLTARPEYGMALLDAVEQGIVPRTDVYAWHIRQLLRFGDAKLNRRIEQVWGKIGKSSEEKQQQIARYKAMLRPRVLAAADLGNGRRLFDQTCAACHTLFGQGGDIGPDLTGSNRADLDYLLQNVIDPSAVVGKDYRATIVATADGRVLNGLLREETDSALTLYVHAINDNVLVPKADIEQRKLSELSVMPEQLLDQLKPTEVRDLVAYLASPVQVAPRGPRAPIDPNTGRVAGALEGEQLKIVRASAGQARIQRMDQFQRDRWSAGAQLWWTGAAPDAQLDLELPVAGSGKYDLQLVLTKARDYGVVQLLLDGKTLGQPIDLFNAQVVTTGVLEFPDQQLAAGRHTLSLKIVGANPRAIKAYMAGLDYVRLVPGGEGLSQ